MGAEQHQEHGGGCLCGAVRYRIDGPVRDVIVCHCSICRRYHGGPAPHAACPRGQIAIDPETRDIIQNEYIRRVEKVNGELYNVEFATIEAVKDPFHGAKK